MNQELALRIHPVVLKLQIVFLGLISGVLAFAAVAVVIAKNNAAGGAAPPTSGVVGPIALAAGALSLVAAPVLFTFLRARGERQAATLDGPGPALRGESLTDRAASLLATYQTAFIVVCAVLEGAAMFNVLAYLLEGERLNLLAAAVVWVALARRLPTPGRVATWIEDSLGRIDQESALLVPFE